MDGMDDLKAIFFTECSELLSDMEDRLLKLDVGVQDKEQLNAIFRCAHSIKGGAGAFGFEAIMTFTHTMEALLDVMREGKLLPAREIIDTLLKSADIVNQMLSIAQNDGHPPANLGAETIAALKSFIEIKGNEAPLIAPAAPQPSAAAEPEHLYEITFAPHEELLASGNEPLLILTELAKLGAAEITTDTSRLPALNELEPTQCYLRWNVTLRSHATKESIDEVFEFVRHISDIRIKKTDAAEAAPLPAAVSASPAITPPEPAHKLPVPKEPAEPAAKTGAMTTSIRVDLEKIDRLVNMVGELVITEAMLKAQVRHLSEDRFSNLLRGVDELSHHTRELQEAVMAVRMQPVKSIFSRMPRIVRDTASQLGKDIQLVMSGENTEVDKTVIEQLGDPLTHMIRNSVDHGIESPDQRAWHDKPAQGTIHLSAYHRSGRIIIEISDDGAGINRERVLAKAKEKGLVPDNAPITPEEIDHLIFLPGFSTAEKVTSVSGRGVGMDVVKRNIEGLGGNVHITNNPGKGSIFTVSLPLTLAILDGMIVRVGTEDYIIPITSIIETLRPRREEIHYVEGKGDVINVRGEFVPVVYLSRIFSIRDSAADASTALTVLVESGTQKMGLVVDELIGQQQVVIKSLAANADPVKGISGATILGDGKVSLILEINELKSLIAAPQRVMARAA